MKSRFVFLIQVTVISLSFVTMSIAENFTKDLMSESSDVVSGTVASIEKKLNVLMLQIDPHGAWQKLVASPRSVVLINGLPSALHHVFNRDRVKSVLFDKSTNEIRLIRIERR